MENSIFRIFSLLISFLSLTVLFSSCSQSLVREETEKERQQMIKCIQASYPTNITVIVGKLSNTSSNATEMDYIDKAVMDTLYAYLRPLNTEKTLVAYTNLRPKLIPEVERLVANSNTSFSNYLTNVPSAVTQSVVYFVTNNDYRISNDFDFSNTVVIRPDNLDSWPIMTFSNFIFISNRFLLWIVTNLDTNDNTVNTNTSLFQVYWLLSNTFSNTITNSGFDLTNFLVLKQASSNTSISTTNLKKLLLSNYVRLIQTEFPGLTNVVPFLNIKLIRNSNQLSSSNLQPWTVLLTGSYQSEKNNDDTTRLKIELQLFGRFDEKSGVSTNSTFIRCSEDVLFQNVLESLKPVRQSLLNRSTGDLLITSEPEDASVYLDSVFIGKTPVYYPSVSEGYHQLNYLRLGNEQQQLRVHVEKDKTNRIDTVLGKVMQGGKVSIASTKTNAIVFIDSFYAGKTPLVISNLSLGTEHRVKIISADPTLKPFYYLFTLENQSSSLEILADMKDYEGASKLERQIAWLGAYAGWGTTVGCLGVSLITHYMNQYYLDQNTVNPSTSNANMAAQYLDTSSTAFTAFLLSSIASGWLTANALSKEEVFLGFLFDPTSESASFSMGFRY